MDKSNHLSMPCSKCTMPILKKGMFSSPDLELKTWKATEPKEMLRELFAIHLYKCFHDLLNGQRRVLMDILGK